MKEYVSDSLRAIREGTVDACSVTAGAMGGGFLSSHAASSFYDTFHNMPGSEYISTAIFLGGLVVGEYMTLSAARQVTGIPPHFVD